METAGLLILAVLLAFYFLPTFVAFSRSHRNALAITLLNIFLGWTLVGWVVAIVWAAMNAAPERVVERVVVRDHLS